MADNLRHQRNERQKKALLQQKVIRKSIQHRPELVVGISGIDTRKEGAVNANSILNINNRKEGEDGDGDEDEL